MGKTTKVMTKLAGIYDPYLDTMGGGERYVLTVAECLIKNGYGVDIFWKDKALDIENLARVKFGLDLAGIKIVDDAFTSNQSIFHKWCATKGYNLFFYLSDGSIPTLFSKKNILHFQVPFHKPARSLINRLKLLKISLIINNSFFTKKFTDIAYGVNGRVLYPPVSVNEFFSGKKENLILSVSRFTRALHNKRQDVLLNAFKLLIRGGLKGWKLVLAGGGKEGKWMIDDLRKEAKELPVEIKVDPTFAEIKELYSKAKIYWTAAGFGVNEQDAPEKVEHFGIALVEAMAAGCVPFALGKGGHKEIIHSVDEGILWQTIEELQDKTLQLIKGRKLGSVSKMARERALNFSRERFDREILEVIS